MAEKSAPKGFSKGLVVDVDPRYQIEGSYRDAMNIKIVNSDGTTFTVENINGNKIVLDLDSITKTVPNNYTTKIDEGILQVVATDQPTTSNLFQDVGGRPNTIGANPMRSVANIVGHYSFRNELILIVCGYIGYGLSFGSQSTGDFRTAFFRIIFDGEGNVKEAQDLRVAFHPDASTNEFPNIGMDPLIKCRVEGVIENDSISRIYWTDNKNPLRTLSINDPEIHQLDPGELDLSPKARHNQIALEKTISGTLPVGVYQYCFKYITDSGAESGISPFSNVYHISNASSSSSSTYYGGDPGAQSNDGFLLRVQNLDTRFDSIVVYSIYYQSLGSVPEVSEVATKNIDANNEVEFRHTSLTTVIENGIENILIPSNTWDVCKDIAIKDNVLFAANLRQKQNYITEKEWNVKVLRYSRDETGTLSGGSLTTTDDSIKDYYLPQGSTYDESLVVEAGSSTSYTKAPLTGLQLQQAHRYLSTKGKAIWNNNNFDNSLNNTEQPRNILGGISYGYYAGSDAAPGRNELGGCIFSFTQVPKVSDTQGNRGGIDDSASPFISTNVPNDSIKTDNLAGPSGGTNNVDTEYKASFTIGSNKDPHASGNKRGYQRGETYRFGVLVYDLNGDPGNVLWIGDIQMPFHHDKAWELDLQNTQLGRDASNSLTKWKENTLAQDYRMSAHVDCPVPGHRVHYDDTSCLPNVDTPDSLTVGQMVPFAPDGTSGYHYTFDLAINFTFRIPEHVRKKISGFRVVRAERTETDRTILQSGLLNQVINYGDPNNLSNGYITTDDGRVGAVSVAASDTANIIDDNVDEVYDSVLNGYSGINGISNRVVGKDSDGNPLYLTEGEADNLEDVYYGASSAEFGSYNFGYKYRLDTNGTDWERTFASLYHSSEAAVMYSPDSTFGIRPYSYGGEDKVAIVSLLKLYNEERRSNTNLNSYDENELITPRLNHGFDDYSTLAESALDSISSVIGAGSDLASLRYANTNPDKGLIFSTKKTTRDDESGVMVGKCHVYDTYWHHYVFNWDYYNNGLQERNAYVRGQNSISNTAFNIAETEGPFNDADNFTTLPNPKNNYSLGAYTIQAFPRQRYWSNLSNAKEIGDGEFVSKDFFADTAESGTGSIGYIKNRGFSNFTLGAAYVTSSDFEAYVKYGKLLDGEDDQLSYETVSTIQMGTRAILLSTTNFTFNVADPGLHIKTQQYLWNKSSKRILTLSTGDDVNHSFTKIPYYNYGNIWKENDGQYGGDSAEAIQSTRWINAGNFHPINVNSEHHHSTVFGGDTFVGLYSHQMTTSPYPEKSYSKWIVFPCESFVNTEMRSGYHLAAGDHIEGFDQDLPPFSNDWFYNDVYSQENTLKSYSSLQDTDQQFTDLPAEIAYSKTKLAGEQTDAFRIFPIFNFYDVESIYGQINRIINFQNEIHFFQENAFGQLLVNPRTFLQDTSGVQSIFTGSGDTIESHQYISIKYGTKHMHSVVASERNLYFFDIRFAKLLKYGTDKKLVSISDDLGTRDLFEKAVEYGRLKSEERYHAAIRVSLADMPLYFIGIHGAFDYTTNSLYMTFSDRLRVDGRDNALNPTGTYLYTGDIDASLGIDPFNNTQTGAFPEKTFLSTTVGYNEDIDSVISKYSVYPQQWIEHNGKIYTPKSRIPWIQYFLEPNDSLLGLENGFRNSSSIYGQRLFGVYSSDFENNESGYEYFTHELADGNLQLWEWEGNKEEKTFFFGEVKNHPSDPTDEELNQTNYQPNITLDNPYPVLNLSSSEETLQSSKIIHKSYIEKVINDGPSENKKFDNLGIVTTVVSNSDNSENILSYYSGGTVQRNLENLSPSMYFEELTFFTDNNPEVKMDIASSNKPGYPSNTSFSDMLYKYREGILRIPLRNQNVTQRAIGTYLRAKLSARTTEKINIFAIIAKYRKSYN
jgi:hypothetical protein